MASFRPGSVLLAAALALAACGAARAHLQELQLSRLHEHPAFAAVGGLSLYNPDSSPEGTSLQISGGIRYVKPYEHDATYDFSGTQFTISRLLSAGEDLTTFELSFSNFLPRTRLFTFDHHFFYGAGLGTALVERDRQETLALPVGSLSVGLQSRIRDFDIESSVKLVVGPRRGVYDVSGTVTQVAVVYPLEF